jgi:hypothetical protein
MSHHHHHHSDRYEQDERANDGYGDQRAPSGYPGAQSHQYQGGPPQHHYQGGPQPEYEGGNQSQGQTHYMGGPPPQATHPYQRVQQPLRRKSLLIGINYVGSQHALRGCQQDVDNMKEVVMRDDRSTDPRGPVGPLMCKSLVISADFISCLVLSKRKEHPGCHALAGL